jgi:hypothetical protein
MDSSSHLISQPSEVYGQFSKKKKKLRIKLILQRSFISLGTDMVLLTMTYVSRLLYLVSLFHFLLAS